MKEVNNNIEIENYGKDLIVFKTHFKGFFTSCFLLEGDKSCILIDSGLSSTAEKILDVISNINKPCNYIINTHSHWDHIGSNGFLKKNTDLKIIMHENGIKYAEDFDLEWDEEYENEFWKGKADKNAKKVYLEMIGEKFKVDIGFNDKLTVKTDKLNLEAFEFFGHSKDSVCIYDKDRKYLFSGDSIIGKGVGAVMNLYSNPYNLRECLINTRDNLEIEVLFSGHHDPIIEKKKILNLINESIDFISLEEKAIKNAIKRIGHEDIVKITQKVCIDLNRNFDNWAFLSVNSFLKG